jgi:hypothetical protein
MDNLDASECRALWLAVLKQALDDLATEPYHAFHFDCSHALFFCPGAWAAHLILLAEAVDRHPDDLRNVARTRLEARLVHEPMTEMPARPVPLPPERLEPPPIVVVQPPPPPVQHYRPANNNSAGRGDWLRRFINSGYRS